MPFIFTALGFVLNNLGLLLGLLLCVIVLKLAIGMAQEYERGVVFRFGRLRGLRGPGLFLLIPFVDRAVVIDTRVITRQLDTQETITGDGVAVKVNAVLWYSAADSVQTVIATADWQNAVQQAAETALRDTIGQKNLDSLLADREQANEALKARLVVAVAAWGVSIQGVELKDLDIPESMQRAIAREAEAQREARARVINAEGEFKAAKQLAEAANVIAAAPGAMELRRLQTLTQIASEHNSTIVVAMPEGAGSTMGQAGLTRALAVNQAG